MRLPDVASGSLELVSFFSQTIIDGQMEVGGG